MPPGLAWCEQLPAPRRPVVSVIIAAFNAEAFLAAAVSSALSQEGIGLEVIIVDDASTDGTKVVMQELARGDARVQCVHLVENRGPSAARNAAIDAARGEWIAILDADDLFLADRLRHLVRAASACEADLIADNQCIRDMKTGQSLGQAFPDAWMKNERPFTVKMLAERDTPGDYKGLPIAYIKPIIRLAFLNAHCIRYSEKHKIGEDFLFLLSCLLAHGKLILDQSVGYCSQIRERSLSRGDESIHQRLFELNKEATALIEAAPKQSAPAFRRRQNALGYELLLHHWRQRRFGEAAVMAWRLDADYITERILRMVRRRLGKKSQILSVMRSGQTI